VKLLPDGEPVQLTHDNLSKMGQVFARWNAHFYSVVAADGASLDTGSCRYSVGSRGGSSRMRKDSRGSRIRA